MMGHRGEIVFVSNYRHTTCCIRPGHHMRIEIYRQAYVLDWERFAGTKMLAFSRLDDTSHLTVSLKVVRTDKFYHRVIADKHNSPPAVFACSLTIITLSSSFENF